MKPPKSAIPLSQHLSAWRERQGYTQEAAARALGFPLGTVRNWEQGRSTPSAYAQWLIIARLKAIDKTKKQRKATK